MFLKKLSLLISVTVATGWCQQQPAVGIVDKRTDMGKEWLLYYDDLRDNFYFLN